MNKLAHLAFAAALMGTAAYAGSNQAAAQNLVVAANDQHGHDSGQNDRRHDWSRGSHDKKTNTSGQGQGSGSSGTGSSGTGHTWTGTGSGSSSGQTWSGPTGDHNKGDSDHRFERHDYKGKIDHRFDQHDNKGGTIFGTRPHNWNERPTHFNKRDYNRNIFSQHRYRWRPYHRPHGWYYRRWVFGDFLPSFFWTNDYWVTDWWSFGLSIPPWGCQWVRVGDDALLIDTRTGEVLEVVYDVFW